MTTRPLRVLLSVVSIVGLSAVASVSHAGVDGDALEIAMPDDIDGADEEDSEDFEDAALDPSPAGDKIFKLHNPFPFPIEVKIYGPGPQFPEVRTIPTPPAGPVPIPYPNTSMKVRVRVAGGSWSKKLELTWRAGPIALPAP